MSVKHPNPQRPNTPNTSKPMPKSTWKTFEHVAEPMVFPDALFPKPAEPDYTISVKDEKIMEEHRFRIHLGILKKHSKYFVAATKPGFPEGRFGQMTIHLEDSFTVRACIEYCYYESYQDTIVKVQEKYPVETRNPRLLPFHIDVCALASKWYIEPLRSYSFSQFEETYRACRSNWMDDRWDEIWGSYLRDAIILAYNKVPTCDRQLHMKLASLVANDLPRLLGNTGLIFAWDEVFSQAPEFCGNLLRALNSGDGTPKTEVQVVCRQCSTRQYFTVRFTANHRPPRFCPWCGTDSIFRVNLLGRPVNLDDSQWNMLLQSLRGRESEWARLFPKLTKQEEDAMREFFNSNP